jgi:hypothetical protein
MAEAYQEGDLTRGAELKKEHDALQKQIDEGYEKLGELLDA